MRVSDKILSSSVQTELVDQLCQLLADIQKPAEMKAFLTAFLGDNELTVLTKRLAMLKALKAGKSYDLIKQELQVSSATISSLRDIIDTYGIHIALEKLTLEAWAEEVISRFWPKKESGKEHVRKSIKIDRNSS